MHRLESGIGKPLVLLHGIGMSSRVWQPLIPLLAPYRRVIAFDIPGFGMSAPLADNQPPTPANLARSIGAECQAMGLGPVEVAGNSLGGWIALEMARQGSASRVTAISPAGLWHRPPAHTGLLFRGIRRLGTTFPALAKLSMESQMLRELGFLLPIAPGGRRIPAADARDILADFLVAPGLLPTLAATDRFAPATSLNIPLTIAYGSLDAIIPPWARRRNLLPAHAQWITAPGWGHVPMWQDPEGVADLILDINQPS